jgi:hypothetical protein
MATAAIAYLAVCLFVVASGSRIELLAIGTNGARLLLLLGVLVVLAALLALLLRRGRRPLRLAGERGHVLVDQATLAEPLQRALTSHVEVVNTHVRLRSRRGRLRARVRVNVRPLVDSKRLRVEFTELERAVAGRITGSESNGVKVRVRVLSVRKLGRHL